MIDARRVRRARNADEVAESFGIAFDYAKQAGDTIRVYRHDHVQWWREPDKLVAAEQVHRGDYLVWTARGERE